MSQVEHFDTLIFGSGQGGKRSPKVWGRFCRRFLQGRLNRRSAHGRGLRESVESDGLARYVRSLPAPGHG